MLKAIFYARFHPERGPSVIHQYPNDSIITTPGCDEEPLLNFSSVSSYVIPSYELCNHPLSICTNGWRVLGFPVSLDDSKYERNRFTFNVCLVLDESEDAWPWEQVVRKTAAFFRQMEQEDGKLQAEERLEGLKWAGEVGYPAHDVGVVYMLLENIMEDLNTYGETCARADDLHVLNLRLMSLKPMVPKVKAWDVPLLVRPLPETHDWTWDLTLQRINPHLGGVKHVQRIAELADVEPKLVKRAVRELLHHERAILLDLFHFQAIYTLTADFSWFVKDSEMQDECSRYIATNPTKNIFRSTRQAARGKDDSALPDNGTVINLYCALSPGMSLHDFCLTNESDLANIDIRRFITFGVIKGFLLRIHKYALALGSRTTNPKLELSNGSAPQSNEDAEKDWDRAWKRAASSSGWATPLVEPSPESLETTDHSVKSADQGHKDDDEKLRKYLDGKHCMDEICVAMRMSEKKVAERLRSERFGEVVLFCK